MLHAAAYDELGLEWTYERRRINSDEFAAAIATLDSTWRGLSLTMPLKLVALDWGSDAADSVALATGAANTASLNGPATTKVWNTDVYGLVTAFRESGLVPSDKALTARVLGAGATATSALAALKLLGANQANLQLLSRRPSHVLGLASRPLEEASDLPTPDFTISTLPSGVELDAALTNSLAQTGGALFDVAYDPWPSALASAWQEAGKPAHSGEGMLVHQAIAQIRIWLTGDVHEPLPDETAVVERMRRALAGA